MAARRGRLRSRSPSALAGGSSFGPNPAQKRSKSPSRRRIAPVEQREAPITRSQAARQKAAELSRRISNAYENKQNIAQTLVNTALLTANASQLKSIIKRAKHAEVDFYHFLIFCLVGSIAFQIISSLCMYVAGKLDSMDPDNERRIFYLNSISTVFIMVYKILNIFVAVFQTD